MAQGRFQGFGLGRINADGEIVGSRFHFFDHLNHQSRLIRPRQTGIDIQNGRSGLYLGNGIPAHHIELAFSELRLEHFASRGIDPLSDNHHAIVSIDLNFLLG